MTRFRGATWPLVVALVISLSGCAASALESSEAASSVVPKPTSEAQADERLAECLTEKGWSVSVAPTGGVGGELPNDQLDKYLEDLSACESATGITDEPFTDEQLTTLYEEYSKVKDCLTEAGYPVPETPSLQTFKDTYGVDGQTWDVYSEVSKGDMGAALAACPQPAPIY